MSVGYDLEVGAAADRIEIPTAVEHAPAMTRCQLKVAGAFLALRR